MHVSIPKFFEYFALTAISLEGHDMTKKLVMPYFENIISSISTITLYYFVNIKPEDYILISILFQDQTSGYSHKIVFIFLMT